MSSSNVEGILLIMLAFHLHMYICLLLLETPLLHWFAFVAVFVLCTGESDWNDEEEEFIREGIENSKKAILQLEEQESLKVFIFTFV